MERKDRRNLTLNFCPSEGSSDSMDFGSYHTFWCRYCRKQFSSSNEFAIHLGHDRCIDLFLLNCSTPSRFCGLCRTTLANTSKFDFLQHCWICVLNKSWVKFPRSPSIPSPNDDISPSSSCSSASSSSAPVTPDENESPLDLTTTSNSRRTSASTKRPYFGNEIRHNSDAPAGGPEAMCVRCKQTFSSSDIFMKMHGLFCPAALLR